MSRAFIFCLSVAALWSASGTGATALNGSASESVTGPSGGREHVAVVPYSIGGDSGLAAPVKSMVNSTIRNDDETPPPRNQLGGDHFDPVL